MPRLDGIEVELGITAEVNGTYIKPSARVKISFEAGESADKDLIVKTWDNAWDSVSREVERVIFAYADSSRGVVSLGPKETFTKKIGG
jgi:hypothetical protein